MLRSYKEFYTFELNKNNELIIKTIEFSHEKESIYFSLNEESDGTARILDLIEILLKICSKEPCWLLSGHRGYWIHKPYAGYFRGSLPMLDGMFRT